MTKSPISRSANAHNAHCRRRSHRSRRRSRRRNGRPTRRRRCPRPPRTTNTNSLARKLRGPIRAARTRTAFIRTPFTGVFPATAIQTRIRHAARAALLRRRATPDKTAKLIDRRQPPAAETAQVQTRANDLSPPTISSSRPTATPATSSPSKSPSKPHHQHQDRRPPTND